MTRPARQNQQARIFALQRKLGWAVCLLVFIGIGVDVVLGQSLLLAKSFGLGVLLSYIAQSAFTFIAYQQTGAKARRAVMLYMYLGQMMKWLITLIGFAVAFMLIKPMVAWLAIVGYLLTQLVQVVAMWRFL